MKYEIKPVTPEDTLWVIEVAAKQMICEEVGRPELYDPSRLDPIVDKIVDEGTGLICWMGDERVGMVGGILSKHFLMPDLKILFEVVWYVEQGHRQTRAPFLLIKGYKEMIESTADEGIFTLLGHSPVKDSSLEKLGFKLQEKHYTYRK